MNRVSIFGQSYGEVMAMYTVADLLAEQDPIKRNELAQQLAETENPDVLDALIILINRNELKDQRGTLVHCLGRFPYHEHIALLAQLVVEGNWEVAHEAYSLINDINHCEGERAKEAYIILKDSQRTGFLEPWQANLVSDVLEMFD